MRKYVQPNIQVVVIETESIATWGSLPFDRNGTDSFDDRGNGIEMDNSGSDYFDAPGSRSSWRDYEKGT